MTPGVGESACLPARKKVFEHSKSFVFHLKVEKNKLLKRFTKMNPNIDFSKL